MQNRHLSSNKQSEGEVKFANMHIEKDTEEKLLQSAANYFEIFKNIL